MNIPDIAGAVSDKGSLRQALEKIQEWATALEDAIGVDPLPKLAQATRGTVQTVLPPPLCAFTVEEAPGGFIVAITLHPNIRGLVLHEIKTSETIPFGSSITVTAYPLNPATRIPLLSVDPLYFQLRSKYLTSDLNAIQTTPESVTPGP